MSQAVYVRSMCTCVSIPVADFHRDKSGRQKINQLNDHCPVTTVPSKSADPPSCGRIACVYRPVLQL